MKTSKALPVLLLSLALAASGADTPAAPAVALPAVKEVTLSNGMRFLLCRRGDAPVFCGTVGFRVGGVDDEAGSTGMAHMFEHMAFKGPRAIGARDWAAEKPVLERLEAVGEELTFLKSSGGDKDRILVLEREMKALEDSLRPLVLQNEFDRIYSEAGKAGLNAFTSQDWTCYHVNLPANRLELWALMESERMRDPVMREFYKERDVVSEERRMRTETSPSGQLWEHLLTTAYMAHPYGRPVIGWMSDIQGLTASRARAFRQAHYAPRNAVGVLVGDIDLDTTPALLERTFGRVPDGPASPPIPTVEPPQRGERRVEVAFDASPRLLIAYHKPKAPDPDDTRAELLAGILGDGPTSRLHRRLVLKDRIAAGAGSWNGSPGARYDNLFMLAVTPLQGHTAAECEAAVYEELERLAKEPVTDAELARIQAKQEVAVLEEMSGNESLARLLAGNQVLAGDWREAWNYLERMRKTTPADLQAFVRKHLVKENRTVATLVTSKEAAK